MNLKKHISIYLALFILLVNSSASLVLHFCHDQIAYVSLVYQNNKLIDSATEASCCPSDAVDNKHDGCCSNEEISTKNKIDYSILKDFHFDFFAVSFINETLEFFGNAACFDANKKNVNYYCNSNAPPFYKLYSQLIFYA
jgi:hypothetical protein